MCITFDLWALRKTESYIAITGHYINDQYQLDCCHFEGQHTAANIADEIKMVTDSWNVSQKINFAISDNAPNVTNAITEHLLWKHYGCFAHKLSLVLQNTLKKNRGYHFESQKNCWIFFKSTSATEKLDQQQLNSNKTPKSLIQDVETRWNSTYYMLARFTELQQEVKITLALLNKNLPIISEEEWSALSELYPILKPFEEITTTLSAAKYVTGSDVIVMTRLLKETCRCYKAQTHIEPMRTFIEKLKKQLIERFGNIEKSGAF